MKILVVEPYFGGSHKQWILQMVQHLDYEFKFLTLTARHWKWRMEGGAIELSVQYKKLNWKPDVILASSMLDLSTFISLIAKGGLNIPSIYYMHENQLTYPKSKRDMDMTNNRDFHYGFIQYKSNLVADHVVYNSHFHKNEHHKAIKDLLSRLPDFKGLEFLDKLKEKSSVLYPGIATWRTSKSKGTDEPISFLWNHRWEYDKNPELFFEVLMQLAKDNLPFKVSVLGASSNTYPEIFDIAKKELKDRILHWGYVEDKIEYQSIVSDSDYLLVTSNQEFFGISVIESVLAGVIPILPKRLCYPEHFPLPKFSELYYADDKDLYSLVRSLMQNKTSQRMRDKLQEVTDKYTWSNQKQNYKTLFEDLVGR